MSNEELVLRYQAGDELAFNELVENNQGLLYKLINNVSPVEHRTYRIETEDLYQVSLYYFMLAARRFDVSKGMKFNTFMGSYISNQLRTYIMDNKYSIRTPRYVVVWSYEFYRLKKKGLTLDEISDEMDISIKELRLFEQRNNSSSYISTSESINKNKNNINAGCQELCVEDLLEYNKDDYGFIDFINSLDTSKLTENEQKLFNIYKKNKMQLIYHQEELADMLGVCQASISRIQRRMFVKLLKLA